RGEASVAIGTSRNEGYSRPRANYALSIAIGGGTTDAYYNGALVNSKYGIAIGGSKGNNNSATVYYNSDSAIAIGSGNTGGAYAKGVSSVAIGGGNSSMDGAKTTSNYAIAVGVNAKAFGVLSVGVGGNSYAQANKSV